MLDFEKFKDYIVENITEYLPQQYEDARISIDKIVKNNDMVLDGLHIFQENTNVTPVIYVNQEYERYKEGENLDEIVGKLADRFVEAKFEEMPINVADLSDYEQVKDRVICRLVNRESNRERLSNAPFTPMEDLAVTYHVLMTEGSDGIGSIMITNALMEEYGIDVETLHTQAMGNMDKLTPVKLETLEDMMLNMMTPEFVKEYGVSEELAREKISEMFPPHDGPEIYCLTNESQINGAAVIANPKTREFVSERVGGDFFILPSSIHELLIVSKSYDMSYEELQSMVQEVNRGMVSPDEILSNHVYQYEAKTHQVSRADRIQNIEQQYNAAYTEQHPALVMENEKIYNANEKVQELQAEPKKHSPMRH